jgi:hypothetical protein
MAESSILNEIDLYSGFERRTSLIMEEFFSGGDSIIFLPKSTV